MSEFTDFLTMKLIAERRFMKRGMSSKEAEVALLEQIKAVKNLNVRAPINMIGLVEVLANRFNVSKAELVMEMLQSSIDEALNMIEKEVNLESFMDDYHHHMEKNYDVKLRRDENNKITGFSFSESAQTEDND
jgi:hypothetical protein